METGHWVKNVFVERPWRRLEYEDIYLRAYETAIEAKRGIERYFTPDALYFGGQNLPNAA